LRDLITIFSRSGHGRSYGTVRILANCRSGILLPLPESPITKYDVKTRSLKCERTFFQVFRLKAILRVGHVSMQNCGHGSFSKKYGVVKK
jgi:hypothetical protein